MGRSNEAVAAALDQVAELLAVQQADVHRVRAYREGASALRQLDRDVAELVGEGEAALMAIPRIGPRLASAIIELLRTGRLGLLERLRGHVSPLDLFTTIPGIGEELAQRIYDELHIDALEELEIAAHDGRLARVPGFGPRRVRAVREELAAMLGRATERRARLIAERLHLPGAVPRAAAPPVALLLQLDADYRRRAPDGRLRHIAPRRFNPSGRAWLPVMHAERDGWSLTAMFSNTPRAHRLGHTHDWVVIYYERDGREDQCTVVTERSGADEGRRVIRGREAECRAHYQAAPRERFELPEALRPVA